MEGWMGGQEETHTYTQPGQKVTVHETKVPLSDFAPEFSFWFSV